MHVAILGTRGIPNHYGGFEQFAEYLSIGLVNAGLEVSVYNSHKHPNQQSKWNGVNIIHCYDPEEKIGTIGQFVYDLNCILDCRSRSFDIILQLGYTSSSVWSRLIPRKKSVVTTNMDGLEWKRSKYSKNVRDFLQYAESLAVKNSDHLISDSKGIEAYLKDKYNALSTFIPYGASVFNTPKEGQLEEYGLTAYDYNLLIARLEPENSIEIILDGAANTKETFIVIGKYETKYGKYLKDKYASNTNIKFLGGLYDIEKLNNLRYFSNLYFHGHTVGGTNPSLLEAMASNALVCAHDNIFNRSILENDALYFSNARDVEKYLLSVNKLDSTNSTRIKNNLAKIKSTYSWPIIVDQYIQHFERILPSTPISAIKRNFSIVD